MECPINGTHGKYSRSTRKHMRLGRMFVVCGHCGQVLQATPNGIFDTNPAKYRAEPVMTRYVTLRLTERDWEQWKQSGIPSNAVFRVGLSSVLQKPLKH
jgi:hypothetical protein